MLQRASGEEDKDLCEMCLATGIGEEKCEAVCGNSDGEETTDNGKVKSGDLEVEATANNGGVILANGVSDMDTLTFKTSEEVEITKVVVERYGYSKNDDVAGLRLENEDGVIISNEIDSINSKGQATLTLKKGYRDVDGTLSATLVIKTAASAGSGNKTIGFKVVDVASTAKNLDLDDYKPFTYSIVNYDGADVIITARGSSKTYNWEAGKSYEVAKFKLKAPSDSAITVKSFTLTDKLNNAIEYDDFLEDVTVTVAGKEVKSSYSVNKDDELVINLKDVELAAKENAEFAVSIELADGFDNMWKSVNFVIEEPSDISATDVKTESRVLVKDSNWSSNWTLTWPTYKFEGGKVRISSTKLGNVEASEDSTDIVIAEGEITTAQTVKVSKGTITISVKNSDTTHGNSGLVVKAMRLEIDGDEYEGYYDKDADKAVDAQKFSFPAIDLDKSGKIRILVDTVEKGTENNYATFTINGLKDFVYEESKTTGDVAGSLNISRLTLAPSKATLVNDISSDEVEFKVEENSDQETIFKGTYTAKKRDIYLNEFTFSGASDAWKAAHKMDVYLYIDGENVADDTLTKQSDGSWLAKDSFTNVKVKAGESVKIEVKAQVEAGTSGANGANLISAKKFNVTIWWEDENGNSPSGKADKSTAKISVVEKGTPEIDSSKANKTVLLRGKDNSIAEFTVKPSGASNMDLEEVSFKAPSAPTTCEDLKLIVGSVDEEFKTVNGRCVVDGFVENISTDGEVAKIQLVEEPDFNASLINIKVEKLELNGVAMSNTYSKAYADAIMTFNQANNKSYTKYTIASLTKYNGSAQVSDLHFYDANGDELKTTLTADTTLAKDDTFTIENNTSSVKIAKMTYVVKKGTDVQNVIINYSDYPDYFKTNDDDLRVYDNGKDSGGSANTWTVSTTTVAAFNITKDPFGGYHGGNQGDLITASEIQENISITNNVIKGTVKLNSWWDNWYLEWEGYFLVLSLTSDNGNKVAVTLQPTQWAGTISYTANGSAEDAWFKLQWNNSQQLVIKTTNAAGAVDTQVYTLDLTYSS